MENGGFSNVMLDFRGIIIVLWLYHQRLLFIYSPSSISRIGGTFLSFSHTPENSPPSSRLPISIWGYPGFLPACPPDHNPEINTSEEHQPVTTVPKCRIQGSWPDWFRQRVNVQGGEGFFDPVPPRCAQKGRAPAEQIHEAVLRAPRRHRQGFSHPLLCRPQSEEPVKGV